ncbi:MAG: radical SAM protein, partial [Methanomassiliicoccales archaeon]
MNIYHMSYIRDFLGERMAMLYFRGCNLSCQECLRKRDEGNIYAEVTEYIRWDLEGIFSFLEEIGPARVYLEGYEPTMDPDLPEIAHRVSSLPAQVTLMTNGSLLTDGYARELIRS